MKLESATMLEYVTYLSPYALRIISISGHSTPFPQIHLWSPLHRLIRIATRAVMEILGLDPYQSQTQYLEGNFRGIAKWKQSGNAVAALLLLCCTFVSASPNSSKNKRKQNWQHVAVCHNPYLQ